jgi:beta-1,2-mannobiose phosphorylase / 1,2-beta-oligomannan phosphorylase
MTQHLLDLAALANPVVLAERLGVIMQSQEGDPFEAWGVLNPAVARGRDGELYLFARVVAEGNYSRIRMARVTFDATGHPCGVERLGLALEPAAPYECRGEGEGGVEDPRITFIPLLDLYVMAYTGFGPEGARVALAVSRDLFSWERIGQVNFGEQDGIDFDDFGNKDAFFFPEPVIAPDGTLSFALMHRPMTGPDQFWSESPHFTDLPSSIWVSYVPVADVLKNTLNLTLLRQHRLVLKPEYCWEHVKVGGGAPPLKTEQGWLLVYHGIENLTPEAETRQLRYSAGVFVVDHGDVTHIVWRSPQALLLPETADELCGVVSNVVFPTGIDTASEGTVDMYYGMADARIGVARIWLRPPASEESLVGVA